MTLELTLGDIEFTGPLDLLLKLVRRNEMDIARINVSLICDQFVSYVEEHKLTELDEGYSFLVLAATLLEIKSRMLLPKSKTGDEEIEDDDAAMSAEDMTRELAMRLSVYESFQNIAKEFESRLADMSRYLPGGMRRDFESTLVLSMKDLSLYDIMNTFQKVLAERKESGFEIEATARPIEEVIEELLADNLLASSGRLLSEILAGQPGVLDLIVTFLAVLELIANGSLDFKPVDGDVLIVSA